MQAAARVSRVATQQVDLLPGPPQRLDHVLHATLTFFSLGVAFHLGDTALAQVHERQFLKVSRLDWFSIHDRAPALDGMEDEGFRKRSQPATGKHDRASHKVIRSN